eukprot:GHVU01148309.1.p3 GENE.GHVU01148309.1~~GHVU01148309.1.p3  ORF type:complete len:106 (-),score=5.16 GHVU01148309.1:388-705(-)
MRCGFRICTLQVDHHSFGQSNSQPPYQRHCNVSLSERRSATEQTRWRVNERVGAAALSLLPRPPKAPEAPNTTFPSTIVPTLIPRHTHSHRSRAASWLLHALQNR